MFLSKLIKKQIVWGYPVYLMVEPTNICNLKCPMCPSGNGTMTRQLGELDYESFKKLLDEKFPDRDKNPEKFGSNINRYGYYKSASTRQYNDEQLGQLLSLQGSAQTIDKGMIPSEAKRTKDDIVVNN